MIYLETFYFVKPLQEELFLNGQRRTCFDSHYPFGVLPGRGLTELHFSDLTLLYGGNGSGKSTVLNIIAEKLEAERVAPFNRTPFYRDYLERCDHELPRRPSQIRFIASDDVFDYMLDVRQLNEGIDAKREERFAEYLELRYSQHQTRSIEDVNELRYAAKRKTQSAYVRDTLMDNVREYSNGESAYRYFTRNIEENGIYLLDEPENSLLPKLQQELVSFLRDSARFFGCQFVIATHSPFLLSMPGARVYDLDSAPVRVRDWHRLESMQLYHELFQAEAPRFEAARKEAENGDGEDPDFPDRYDRH